MRAHGRAGVNAHPNASALCEDRELLAPSLVDLICPNVASSPASLFDGLMPVLGATIVALLIAAAVMLLGGLILRRAGRTSTAFDDAPIGRDHDEL